DVCSSDLGQTSEQSAEDVPLSDTCQSPHTPFGGSHELQLLRVSPVNSPLKVCFARAQCCSDMGLNGSSGHSLLREGGSSIVAVRRAHGTHAPPPCDDKR